MSLVIISIYKYRHTFICVHFIHFKLTIFVQVLQRPLDLELELLSDPKDPKSLIGRVYIMCLNSQPVDHEDATKPVIGN